MLNSDAEPQMNPLSSTTSDIHGDGALGGDHLLASVVSMLDARGASNANVLVTLTVGGHSVEGLLIGIDEYLAAQASRLRLLSRGQGDFGDDLASLFEDERELRGAGRSGAALDSGNAPRYVHVKDARIDGKDRLLVWRGRLAEVSGWTFGVLD